MDELNTLETYKKALELLKKIPLNEIIDFDLNIYSNRDELEINTSLLIFNKEDGERRIKLNDFLKSLIRGKINLILDTTKNDLEKIIKEWQE